MYTAKYNKTRLLILLNNNKSCCVLAVFWLVTVNWHDLLVRLDFLLCLFHHLLYPFLPPPWPVLNNDPEHRRRECEEKGKYCKSPASTYRSDNRLYRGCCGSTRQAADKIIRSSSRCWSTGV